MQSPRIDDLVTTTLSHPPAARAAPDRPVAPELTNVRLTGIVVEPDRRTAIFAVQGAKPLVRSEGETVNDWHLDAIAPREVTVTGPAGTTTLEPKADPNLVRTAQPAQPTPVSRPATPPAQPVAAGARPPFPVAAAPQPKPTALPTPPIRMPKLQPNPARPAYPVRPPQ